MYDDLMKHTNQDKSQKVRDFSNNYLKKHPIKAQTAKIIWKNLTQIYLMSMQNPAEKEYCVWPK